MHEVESSSAIVQRAGANGHKPVHVGPSVRARHALACDRGALDLRTLAWRQRKLALDSSKLALASALHTHEDFRTALPLSELAAAV